MIIYLTRISPNARCACAQRDATIPEDQRAGCPPSVLSCTAWGFSASRIAPRAVSSYLAFSTLPVPLLPKNRRCLFCDTFRHRNFTTAAPAYFTRHVAVWCSDFPPASHCGSPAIICHRRAIYHNQLERKETRELRS